MIRALCIGECMLELRHVDATTMRLGYAGDTYNTAVYLRRVAAELGVDVEVGYLSGLGDDADSRAMRAAWEAEGIRDRGRVFAGKAPGLYTVRTDAGGERSFAYWRSDSAARAALAGVDWTRAIEADLVYLSGITLQLMTPASRAALMKRLEELRPAGTRVALDTNYRPQGWPAASEAAAAIDAATRCADVVFATLEDERALHGVSTAEQCLQRLAALGAREILVKAGPEGVWVGDAREITHLPAVAPERLVDTTAAGDALAGAFLAAALAGRPTLAAAELAMRVASVVIAHPGALTPAGVSLVGV